MDSLIFLPNAQKCASRSPVIYNFALYNNATALTEPQKLIIDKEFTGKIIVKTFIASAITALILSLVLLVDRIKWHFWEASSSTKSSTHRLFYIRLIHILQRLLHALGDHQLIASIALLVTFSNHACSISAYQYNLACVMLVLSVITHPNCIVGIQDFIHKGKLIATYRLLAIGTQFFFDADFLPNGTYFACNYACSLFHQRQRLSLLGFGDAIDAAQNLTSSLLSSSNTNSTIIPFNATSLLHEIEAATSSSDLIWQYIVLVICVALTIIFLLAEWLHTPFKQTPKNAALGLSAMILSGLTLLVSAALAVMLIAQYNNLRNGMEVPSFVQTQKVKPGYAAFVSIFLVAGVSLHGVQAFTESLLGHKGRRFAQVCKEAYTGLDGARNADRGNETGNWGGREA
ncbi:hypothetical protein BKA63DRAFT_602248 [Paraphoma chrysanthemicola]|nr:hypothetical protein BKA63DRAFT_602248 [Paraphoma chrysanthemicola]